MSKEIEYFVCCSRPRRGEPTRWVERGGHQVPDDAAPGNHSRGMATTREDAEEWLEVVGIGRSALEYWIEPATSREVTIMLDDRRGR